MARISSIRRLPEDVQDLIAKLRRNGRSLDEIMEKLRELEITVSRSALGRHAKTLEAAIARRNRARMMSQALAETWGDKPVSDIRRANQELIETHLNEMLLSFDEDKPFDGDIKKAYLISAAHEKLNKSAKHDDERIAKHMDRFQAAAVKAVEKVAKGQGLTKATVTAIKEAILGVKAEDVKAFSGGG